MSKRPDTDEAARLVTSVAPRRSVEDAVRASGLELLGHCERLSQQPGLLQQSPMLRTSRRTRRTSWAAPCCGCAPGPARC